ALRLAPREARRPREGPRRNAGPRAPRAGAVRHRRREDVDPAAPCHRQSREVHQGRHFDEVHGSFLVVTRTTDRSEWRWFAHELKPFAKSQALSIVAVSAATLFASADPLIVKW